LRRIELSTGLRGRGKYWTWPSFRSPISSNSCIPPTPRVGAGDERVEVAAAHDPPVTFWACTDGGDEAGSPAHREGSGHVVEQNEQEASMSKFVAIVFPNEEKIPEAVRTLRNMHGGKGIKLFGSAVVVRDPGGKLSVQEITKEGHGGAAVGALIAALAGVLGAPSG
jgi:hypothetical protein